MKSFAYYGRLARGRIKCFCRKSLQCSFRSAARRSLGRSIFISQGVDAYTIVCVGCALLDYHLDEYQRRLEEAMRSDRTFGES